MIRTVLIPADFSAGQRAAPALRAGLAALGVTRAVLANVVETSGLEGPVIAATVDAARETHARATSAARDAGLDVEVRIPTGDPERELLALAAEACVDAIVIGTRGKSVTDAFFAGGSVSERVARGADIPVMLVRFALLRNAEDPAKLAASFGHKLLVPDGLLRHGQRARSSRPRRAAGRGGRDAARAARARPDATGETRQADRGGRRVPAAATCAADGRRRAASRPRPSSAVGDPDARDPGRGRRAPHHRRASSGTTRAADAARRRRCSAASR